MPELREVGLAKRIRMTPNTQQNSNLADFEGIYRAEYQAELDSCDRWIQWCKEHKDSYGINFHQGLRSALVFNNIKMEQLLRILKGAKNE